VRAHHYAIAERYVHLAQAEPTVANQRTGSERDHIPASSATS
jgi:hypothetical protein